MLFGRKEKTDSITLSDFQQDMVCKAEKLLDVTKSKLKSKGKSLTLTPKRQIMDDCNRIEKLLAKIRSGKINDSTFEKLDKAIVCLETTSGNIL
ncbi:MAG: hypothetical protein E7265_02800 [Lachnospiraceae bacterium]|nr:hypothetical protein [Lachnospiraceae bacterium]